MSIGVQFVPGQGSYTVDFFEPNALEYIDRFVQESQYDNTPSLGLEGSNTLRVDRNGSAFALNRYAVTGHGTHVAGIIGAALNGTGVVGVCPTCSVSMFRTITDPSALALSAERATRFGNQVINLSVSPLVPVQATGEVPPPGMDVIAEESESPLNLSLAAAGTQDVFVVAAAGNDGTGGPNASATNPFVTAAGATDLTDYPWSETRLENNPTQCATSSGGCGTFYPTAAAPEIADRFVFAPGARILSTMYSTWIGRLPIGGVALQRSACTHELFPADAVNGASQFNSRYGMCTGTSMAAPYVSAVGALIRSVHPLLEQTQVREVLKSTGNPVNYTAGSPAAVGQPKRINAQAAVQSTLATIAGTAESNRIIPLMAARSLIRQTASAASSRVPHRDWLFSTKPQMLASAHLGNLYFAGYGNVTGQRNVAYFGPLPAPNDPPIIDPLPGISNIGGYPLVRGTRFQAKASAFIFATQRQPYAGAPDTLIPLYRLAMKGNCLARKHVYTTSLAPAGLSFSSLSNNGNTCAGTSFDTPITSARFEQVAVEGFVFPTQQPGTVPLRLKYNSANNGSYALMIPSDDARVEFSGYGNPPAQSEVILGYVYENASSDGDVWPDAWENMVGMNNQTSNGDCDGLSDDQEFPMAALSTSDPMTASSTCADRRVNIRLAANQIRLEMSNFGTATASNVFFYFYTRGSTALPVLPLPQGCYQLTSGGPNPIDSRSAIVPPDRVSYRCEIPSLQPGQSLAILLTPPSPNVVAEYFGEVEALGSPALDPSTSNNFVAITF